MLPYKFYLIDHYNVQEPMLMDSIVSNSIPNTVLTMVWKTRIIDTLTGKTMTVPSVDEAKLLIDHWALLGDPEALLAREKELEEKRTAFETLETETKVKIQELFFIIKKSSDELAALSDVTPPRFQ